MAKIKKEDTQLPSQSLPTAEIPDLKKKKEERKKSGAAWGSAKPAGATFGGAAAEEGVALGERAAIGVARAAASAARASGAEAAAELAAGAAAETGFFAQIAAAISSMSATLLGKAAIMAAIALVAGAIAAVAYRMAHSGSASGNFQPDLGAIASTVKVSRQAGDSGLGYVNQAGLLKPSASAPLPEPAGEAAKAGPQDTTANNPAETSDKAAPQNAMPADVMAHNLSGSKLSAGLGGQFGAGGAAMAGAKVPNIGAQNGMMGKFGQNGAAAGAGGKLQAKNAMGVLGNSLRHLSATSSHSLALLRGMASRFNPSMQSGGNQATEYNSEAASEQFEASGVSGGTPPTSPTDSSGGGGGGGGGASTGGGTTVNPIGTNPPTIDNPNCDYAAGAYWNGTACVTTSPTGTNQTPWQGKVNTCTMLVTGAAALLIVGSILARIGWKLLFGPSWALGAHLLMIAAWMILAAGVMAITTIIMGMMINGMGGSPQGTMFAMSGTLLTAAAAMALFCPLDNLLTATIIPAIMAMCAEISSSLG